MDIAQKAASGFDEAVFSRFAAGRNEPAWLLERRREAFAHLSALGLPSSSDDEWRRTDIRGFRFDAFSAPGGETNATQESAAGLVHHDGALAGKSVQESGGARLMDLAQAVLEIPELLHRYFATRAVTANEDVFAALHTAFCSSGTVLHVPRGVRVEAPFLSTIGLSGGRTDFSHTLVLVEEGAEAALVREAHTLDASDEPALHAGALEIFVAPGARLKIVDVQNWGLQTWHFSRERAFVARDASLDWSVAGFGSRLAKVNQEVVLDGPGASAKVNGVMFTSGRQHLAYFTRQDHRAPHTTSDLLYKGGLRDRSRIVWKGMIRVEKDAQRTDAYQRNDNLVLSERARADSIPGLEIEANDVRCTHGATAGRVDEDMVFYAQARGVPRQDAVRLVVEGFFTDVVDRVPIESAREALRGKLTAKL